MPAEAKAIDQALVELPVLPGLYLERSGTRERHWRVTHGAVSETTRWCAFPQLAGWV